jgi:hypothetical protein
MIRKHVPTALVAAAFLTVVAAAPAQAAAKTKLTLGITAEAGYARAVLLRCSPPGGGHPKAAQACAALKAAGGRPAALEPAEVVCTLQYTPVTATVAGAWKGRKVTWSRTFGNECELTRATGVVFRF